MSQSIKAAFAKAYHQLTPDEAKKIADNWRLKYPEYVKFWQESKDAAVSRCSTERSEKGSCN